MSGSDSGGDWGMLGTGDVPDLPVSPAFAASAFALTLDFFAAGGSDPAFFIGWCFLGLGRCRGHRDREREPFPARGIRHGHLVHLPRDLSLPPSPQQPARRPMHAGAGIAPIPIGQKFQ